MTVDDAMIVREGLLLRSIGAAAPFAHRFKVLEVHTAKYARVRVVCNLVISHYLYMNLIPHWASVPVEPA